MARIFLSHSSANDAEAIALRDWLIGEGWDDLFLDLDPERGIVAGERWERALSEAANRCEAVLCLVSRAWLASSWCVRELQLALRLNKRIVGILLDDLRTAELPVDLTSTWQMVNLASGADHRMFRATLPSGREAHVTFSTAGLAKLKAGLAKAGLDARFFAWPPDGDPDRPPYRGLRPLEAEDAGIFFGREAPTIAVLDRLRGLSETPPPRVFVVLGASGAGKSSFLRAGLVPRLRRDDRHFLPLPIVRPERAAVTGETGVLRSLELALQAAGLRRTRADVRTALESGARAVGTLLAALTDQARAQAASDDRRAPPRLVLPVDQGEELFLAEGADEARAFLLLVRELASAAQSNLIVLFTIRSDAIQYLQTAPAFEGIDLHTFPLSPLPRGAYQTVIEGPSARLSETRRLLRIEPALSAALLSDVEAGAGKDALPLLAFTLERLYLEHGGDGDLTLAEYRAIGGIKGSIEAAVERALEAADRDQAVPKDRAARLALLRRALIPWLAGIDPETGAPRRRVARLAEIPAEARPLVEHLIAARLLSTDRSPRTGERTVEPAHEALLRQWGLLQGWLEEDFAALTTLEGVKRAARDWEANDRHADWLAHTAGRREEAEALLRREDLAPSFDAADRDYLDACRIADAARRDRELEEARQLAEERRKVVRRTRVGLIAASVLAVVALAAMVDGYFRKLHTQETLTQAAFLEGARLASEGKPGDALAHLARAMRGGSRAAAARAWNLLATRSWPRLAMTVRHLDGPRFAAFSPDGTRVLAASGDEVRVWDAANGTPVTERMRHTSLVTIAAFSPDGRRIVTGTRDNAARIWDSATGRPLIEPIRHDDTMTLAAFSPDGTRIVTGSGAHVRIWDAATGRSLTGPIQHAAAVNVVAFSSDGTRVLTAGSDHAAWVWDAATGRRVTEGMQHEGRVHSAAFSPDGTRIVTTSASVARMWDAMTGAPRSEPMAHEAPVVAAAFSPDGTRIVTASWDRTAQVWAVADGTRLRRLMHEDRVDAAAFGPAGMRILTRSLATARVWDVASGRLLVEPMRHPEPVVSAAFSPDGSRIVTASLDDAVRVWNAAVGRSVPGVIGGRDVVSATFSPEGRRIATGSRDGTVQVWDAATTEPVTEPMQHGGPVVGVAFSPDGTRIVTRSRTDAALVWDAVTAAAVTIPLMHDDIVDVAVFSPDGGRIITGSRDGKAYVWDATSGERLIEAIAHKGPVKAAAFSPDGRRFLTGSWDGTVRVWDATSGQPLTEPLSPGFINVAGFSPDGSRLLTAAWPRRTAEIWDAVSGQRLVVLRRHQDDVVAAAFSPDGARVITGSMDGSARIWDAGTGAPVTEPMRGAGESLATVAFSPDGERAITGFVSGMAQIWDAATGAPLTAPMHTDGSTGALVGGFIGEIIRKPMVATFSPSDGTRIVMAADSAARVWDAPAAPPPAWAADLAETLSGSRLSDQGVATSIPDRHERELRFRELAARATGKDPWTLLLRWLYTPPGDRTISPLSKLSVRDFVAARLARRTEHGLREAIEADPSLAHVYGLVSRGGRHRDTNN